MRRRLRRMPMNRKARNALVFVASVAAALAWAALVVGAI